MVKNVKQLACEFIGITEEEFDKRLVNLEKTTLDDWANKDSITGFYETTDIYLYTLIRFNNIERISKLIYPLNDYEGLKILDYGAGLGIVSNILAEWHNVYYYDLPSRTRDLALFLNGKLPNTTTFVRQDEDPFDKDINTVICADVLEHLENPMELVGKITKKLQPGGLFLTTGLEFSMGPHIPMHLPENLKHRKVYHDHMKENYYLMFYQVTKNEIIYLYKRK